MDLLYANDKPGQYPKSWYAATAEPLPACPPLDGEIRADVCIVGAGYTGLSAAYAWLFGPWLAASGETPADAEGRCKRTRLLAPQT